MRHNATIAYMKSFKNFYNKKGSVLVFSLIITMLILMSVIILNTFIVGSIKRSRLAALSLKAYYAAESIVEKTLYDLRKERKRPADISYSNTNCGSGAGFTGIENNLGCSVEAEYDTEAIIKNLKKNKSSSFKIFDSSGNENIGAGVDTLQITCLGNNSLWLEVTRNVMYSSSGLGPDANFSKVKKNVYSCADKDVYVLLPDIALDSANSYLIFVKALYNDAPEIRVKARAGGKEKKLGDYFVINARANYDQLLSQNIRVQLPGIVTASSLFDYVIYSESTITK